MKTENRAIPTRGGDEREAFLTLPDYETPKAAVLMLHGMAEHKERYREFAEVLCKNGFAAIAYDHAGHGASLPDERRTGLLGEKAGADAVVADCLDVRSWIEERLGPIPCVLFGHSFGSFVAREVMRTAGDRFTAFVFSGTAAHPGVRGRLGRRIAAIAVVLRGANKRAPRLQKLTTGGNNRHIASPRTSYDWLSRDRSEVDAYVEDPACGFVPCTSFFRDLATLLLRINSPRQLESIVTDRPVLIIAGDDDPVTAWGRGTERVREVLNSAGVKSVDVRRYKSARHELLHETNRREVFRDIIGWLLRKTGNTGA